MHDDQTPQECSAGYHELLKSAALYAASAMAQLIQSASEQPEELARLRRDYVDLVFGLELEFVFPGLQREQRDTLVSLMKVRNGLLVQFGGVRQWRTEADRAAHLQAVRNLKVDFLRLKTQLERQEIHACFNDMQKRILKEELLSLPSDKTDSTTFFHRRSREQEEAPGSVTTVDEASAGRELVPGLEEGSGIGLAAEDGGSLQAGADHSGWSGDSYIDVRRLGQTDRKILFVTANAGDYRAAVSKLADAGYGVEIAVDLKSALEAAIDNTPDLVVLDLALPASAASAGAGGGSIALRVLKGLALVGEEGRPVVLGVCEPGAAKPTEEELEGHPLAAVLRKPIQPQRLLGAICVALDDTTIETAREVVPAESPEVVCH